MKNVYKIPEENLEKLNKKLAAINNKAKKLGCGEIFFNVIGEEYTTDRENMISAEEALIEKLSDADKKFYKVLLVEVEGTAPHFDGWKFIASLQPTAEGNIIRNLSDEAAPEQYRTVTLTCDHCGVNRYRKDTFLIRNIETGEFKQVGRSCLKDFFNGRDPQNVARYAELLDSISGHVGKFYEASHTRYYINVEEYLSVATAVIKKHGWVSKTKANEEQIPSTASRAFDEMFIRNTIEVTMENIELAKKALEWIKEQETTNEYMYNLKTTCLNLYIDHTLIGFAASLIPTYLKSIEKKKEVSTNVSNFVGAVKDKIEMELKLIKSFAYTSQWGVGYFHRFEDKDGNILVWKTGTSLEEGIYNVKGTIQSHDVYKGNNETYLTRCKIERVKEKV